jgi:hypothetical protein
MPVALHTTIRDIHGRASVTLPVAVRQALMAADEVLRLHGMQFELHCEDCNRAGRTATVAATHGADDSLDGLVCACTRRRFLSAF